MVEVAAIVRIPPRMIPMQGVQPTAKIAPSPNDASQPPRAAHEPPAEPVGRGPAVSGAGQRDRAGRGRERARRAGVERSPGALQRRDAQDAREVEPEDDQDDAADCAQRVEIVGRAGRPERRREPSRVNTAPNPATYAMAWRMAVQRDGVRPSADEATAIAVSWPR